jgi:hypothetical protein
MNCQLNKLINSEVPVRVPHFPNVIRLDTVDTKLYQIINAQIVKSQLSNLFYKLGADVVNPYLN